MDDKNFEHLFPSPGLSEAFKGQKKSQPLQKHYRKNLHINSESFKLQEAKIEEQAAKYRQMISENKYKFLTSMTSVEKLRNSLQNKRYHTPPRKREEQQKIVRQAQKDLYEKIQLHKTAIQETPMIFMQGKVQIFQIQNFSAQLQIPKVVNYTPHVADSISCRVIAVEKRIDKNEIHLKAEQYQIVLAGYLPALKPRSSLSSVQITGKWVKCQKYHRLYLLLINEVNCQILFITRCKNLHEIAQKAMKYEKIDQIIY